MEKVEKYPDLGRVIGRLRNAKTSVVPAVVVALVMVTDNLAMFLDRTGVIELLQKAALL